MWHKKYTEPTRVNGLAWEKPLLSHKKVSRYPVIQPGLLAGLILVTLATGVSIYLGNKKTSHQPLPGASSINDITRKPSVPQIDTAIMSERINQIIAAHPEVQISVSVIDLKDNAKNNYGENVDYLAASVNKILTAVLYMHEVEQGSRSLDASIGDLPVTQQLSLMIEQSDNDAWVALNTEMGHPALQSWASQIGLSSYNAETNEIAPKDVALLLSNLYQKRLLSASHTQLLLSYMQKANENQYIESAVPDGVKVYHKAGWLTDRVLDAAIIDDGNRPYVLVIFTKMDGDYDDNLGQSIFHDITKATVDTYIKG